MRHPGGAACRFRRYGRRIDTTTDREEENRTVCACGTLPDVRAELATVRCRRRRCVCWDVVPIDVQRTISRRVAASGVLYFTRRWEATLRARTRARPPAFTVVCAVFHLQSFLSCAGQNWLPAFIISASLSPHCVPLMMRAIYSSTLRLLLCVPGCSCKKKKGGGKEKEKVNEKGILGTVQRLAFPWPLFICWRACFPLS